MMIKLTTKRLFEVLSDSMTSTDPPRLLTDVLADCILDVDQGLDPNAAHELAEEHWREVSTLVVARHDEAQSSGRTWILELCGSEDEYVRGSSFADLSLSSLEQQVRSNRRHTLRVKAELLAVQPTEFESVCTEILRFLGCKNAHTSVSSNDGGIDFYGRLELEGRLDSQLPYGGVDRRAGVWLVGQAKHYKKGPVGTAPVRELVGSIDLARTGGAIHSWDGLTLRPYDAVIQLLFTTGKFTAGAQRLVESTGLIVMDGNQISALLADVGVGIDPTTDEFDAAFFRRGLGLDPRVTEVIDA